MAEDPGTEGAPPTHRPDGSRGSAAPEGPGRPDERSDLARRQAVVAAGYRRDVARVRASVSDPDAGVRAAALSALARADDLGPDDLVRALGDPDPSVRLRAGEVAAERASGGLDPSVVAALLAALADGEPLIVEAACWALGEIEDPTSVEALALVSRDHPDARCREAAVAALGAIGDPAGLPAILERLEDRPAVRRRVAVALSAFPGAEAQAALARCLDDRDWQVRAVAEELTGPGPA